MNRHGTQDLNTGNPILQPMIKTAVLFKLPFLFRMAANFLTYTAFSGMSGPSDLEKELIVNFHDPALTSHFGPGPDPIPLLVTSFPQLGMSFLGC